MILIVVVVEELIVVEVLVHVHLGHELVEQHDEDDIGDIDDE